MSEKSYPKLALDYINFFLENDKVDVNFAPDNIHPLHFAIHEGDVTTIQALLKKGADVNFVGKVALRGLGSMTVQTTPLLRAIDLFLAKREMNRIPVVSILLQNNPDLTKSKRGRDTFDLLKYNKLFVPQAEKLRKKQQQSQ